MSPKTSNNGFVFPLWVRNEALGLDFQANNVGDVFRFPNFSYAFLKNIAKRFKSGFGQST